MSPNQKNALVSKLLANNGEEMRSYFVLPKGEERDPRIWDEGRVTPATTAWIKKYKVASALGEKFSHDEPWLTLMALYGLFGNQSQARLKESPLLVNQLLEKSFPRAAKEKTPAFKEITSIHLEVQLQENLTYREYLQVSVFKGKKAFHPYADVRAKLAIKLNKESPSLEGNTHLDALISGKDAGDQPIHIFIEAKFLSDIDTKVSYVPVRNQIARNIDCAIALMMGNGKGRAGLQDFWFVLLTPAMFRTEKFGGNTGSPLRELGPDRSRFYCYKMDEYLKPEGLMADLPHWKDKLQTQDWELLSSHIGWLTFEEILQTVERTGTLHKEEKEDYREFFKDRGITEATCP